MIALGIFAIVIFSVGVLIPLSQVRSFNSTNRETALTVADNLMERIRALNFEDVVVDSTYDGGMGIEPANKGTYYQYPPKPYPSTSIEIFYPGPQSSAVLSHRVQYFFNVTASYDVDEDGQPIKSLKKVIIVVTWNQSVTSGQTSGGNRQNCAVTLSSKILER
jgi:hypothetical protein